MVPPTQQGSKKYHEQLVLIKKFDLHFGRHCHFFSGYSKYVTTCFFYKQHFYKKRLAEIGKKISKS